MSKGFRDFDLKSIVESCDTLGYGGKISTITDLEHYCSMKRKEILSKHKSAITELRNGKYEGLFQTFVRDEKTGKRRVLRAKSRSELDDKLLAFYTSTKSSQKHTVDECFRGWIKYLAIDKRPSTIRIYETEYRRHFQGIKDLYIEDFNALSIKVHAKTETSKKKLTQKGFSSYKTNVYGIWHYAKDKGYINYRIEEVYEELRRELKGSFYPSKKSLKKDEDLVLSDEELKKLKAFCENSHRLDDLGIHLLTGTGLRVGELVALRKSDVSKDGKYLLILQTEERVGDGADYVVSDKPKTEAGYRTVLLTSDMSRLIEQILKMSNSNSNYIFSDKTYDRYNTKKIRDRLYRVCKYAGIKKRSPHALRRTYASMLSEAGVPEELIIRQMGHVDIDITKKCYIYNRKSTDELISILEHAS